MDEAKGWTGPDAWILASVTPSRRGFDLSRVIGTADAFNHDIPSRDQLASSLGALIDAGLVEVADKRFRLTRVEPDVASPDAHTSQQPRVSAH